MSNFSMGTISGMGFAQAQVHTVPSTSAKGIIRHNKESIFHHGDFINAAIRE